MFWESSNNLNLGHSWDLNPPELSIFLTSVFHVVQRLSLFSGTVRVADYFTLFIRKKEGAGGLHFSWTLETWEKTSVYGQLGQWEAGPGRPDPGSWPGPPAASAGAGSATSGALARRNPTASVRKTASDPWECFLHKRVGRQAGGTILTLTLIEFRCWRKVNSVSLLGEKSFPCRLLGGKVVGTAKRPPSESLLPVLEGPATKRGRGGFLKPRRESKHNYINPATSPVWMEFYWEENQEEQSVQFPGKEFPVILAPLNLLSIHLPESLVLTVSREDKYSSLL